MNLWVAIDVDDQLRGIREKRNEVEKKLQYDNYCNKLPLHISLKITFQVDDRIASEVISTICEYYRTLDPFEFEVDQIENARDVVWIRMKPNEELMRVHNDLDYILKERFEVPIHLFDQNFLFHTSLFMSADGSKNQDAYQGVKDTKVPKKLTAKKFVVGYSETGELGTYAVCKEVNLE